MSVGVLVMCQDLTLLCECLESGRREAIGRLAECTFVHRRRVIGLSTSNECPLASWWCGVWVSSPGTGKGWNTYPHHFFFFCTWDAPFPACIRLEPIINVCTVSGLKPGLHNNCIDLCSYSIWARSCWVRALLCASCHVFGSLPMATSTAKSCPKRLSVYMMIKISFFFKSNTSTTTLSLHPCRSSWELPWSISFIFSICLRRIHALP